MKKHLNDIPIALQLIDSPKRDLENKLVLACHLANSGIASIIGTQQYIRHVHAGSKGCLWLGRFGSVDGNHALDKALRKGMPGHDTRLFYIHDEGAFFLKGFFESSVIRTHPIDLVDEKQTEKIFFWGSKQQDIYSKHTTADKQSLLASVGAPRFDLCKKKYAKLDLEQVTQLQEKHGDFVLICTQFSRFNHAPDVNRPFDQRSIELAQYGFATRSEAMNHVFNLWSKVGNNFLAFVKFVQEIAFAHPDQQFVLRPHPAENLDFYEDVFAEFSNLTVDSTGDLRPILRAAKLMIHSECTSGFEAVLTGTPTINYVPQSQYPELAIEGLETLAPVATTQVEALQAVSDVLKGRTTGLSTIPESFNQIIANIENESMPIIAEHLENFCAENNWVSSLGTASPKQQVIHSLVSAKKRTKFLLGSKRSLGKHVPFTAFEVEKLFDNIQQIVGGKGKLISVSFDHIVVSP